MKTTEKRWLRAGRRAAVALLCLGWVAGALAQQGVPGQRLAPEGAPNVVVVLLDDVGFGAASTFGGPAETPALDALAEEGLRYNRFHTTGICSPTRASLLTGHDPHAAGVGTVLNSANDRRGYEGVLRPETAVVAEVLRQQGDSTAAFGKWHLTPDWEVSPAGPFARWPTGVGLKPSTAFWAERPTSTTRCCTAGPPPSSAPIERTTISLKTWSTRPLPGCRCRSR